MSLKDISIKQEYRSLSDDIVNDFYIPLLQEATLYQRAVGFFSSSALIELTKGICGLVKNEGKIKLIASPRLSKEDIEAINDGLKKKEEVIEEILLRNLENHSGDFQEERLNLLSNLIASGVLEIKIAFLNSLNEIAMYHEKMGLITDFYGNSVAFSGSMNESFNAFKQNYESIDVFTSWSESSCRVKNKINIFNSMWNNTEKGIQVLEFPKVSKAILDKYKLNDKLDLDLDSKQFSKNQISMPFQRFANEEDGDKQSADELQNISNNESIIVEDLNSPHIPSSVKIRDYQQKAIDNWEKNNYCGIYDMATGTGKTLTALASIVRLYNDNNRRLGVIIVCPYQHLVEQWVEDIERFGIRPIIGYSSSKQKHWKKNLEQAIRSFNLKVSNHFCFITTNASFVTKDVQIQIENLSKDVVFVVDEAHNIGALNYRKFLPYKINYRLALSATIERHNDELGSSTLYEYFGNKCIEFTLKDAIENRMLTRYYYYPVLNYLDSEELEDYLTLTKQIIQSLPDNSHKKISISELTKRLLIKRSRIIAGTRSKLISLKECIEPYRNEKHILVYCGATNIRIEEDEDIAFDTKQIDLVARLLGNKLGMRIGRFTSQESIDERRIIKENFADGKILQALVAIKCLDEGVNIPSIKTAFILASSTNPKEYIQRRGRVLRLYSGKDSASIYDFVTLPFNYNSLYAQKEEVITLSKGLVRRELIRMLDFAEISENPSETFDLVYKLKHGFNLSETDLLREEVDNNVI